MRATDGWTMLCAHDGLQTQQQGLGGASREGNPQTQVDLAGILANLGWCMPTTYYGWAPDMGPAVGGGLVWVQTCTGMRGGATSPEQQQKVQEGQNQRVQGRRVRGGNWYGGATTGGDYAIYAGGQRLLFRSNVMWQRLLFRPRMLVPAATANRGGTGGTGWAGSGLLSAQFMHVRGERRGQRR